LLRFLARRSWPAVPGQQPFLATSCRATT